MCGASDGFLGTGYIAGCELHHGVVIGRTFSPQDAAVRFAWLNAHRHAAVGVMSRGRELSGGRVVWARREQSVAAVARGAIDTDESATSLRAVGCSDLIVCEQSSEGNESLQSALVLERRDGLAPFTAREFQLASMTFAHLPSWFWVEQFAEQSARPTAMTDAETIFANGPRGLLTVDFVHLF